MIPECNILIEIITCQPLVFFCILALGDKQSHGPIWLKQPSGAHPGIFSRVCVWGLNLTRTSQQPPAKRWKCWNVAFFCNLPGMTSPNNPRNLQQDPLFTDPEKTWISNSCNNLLRAPLVRSHLIFDMNYQDEGDHPRVPTPNSRSLALHHQLHPSAQLHF